MSILNFIFPCCIGTRIGSFVKSKKHVILGPFWEGHGTWPNRIKKIYWDAQDLPIRYRPLTAGCINFHIEIYCVIAPRPPQCTASARSKMTQIGGANPDRSKGHTHKTFFQNNIKLNQLAPGWVVLGCRSAPYPPPPPPRPHTRWFVWGWGWQSKGYCCVPPCM